MPLLYTANTIQSKRVQNPAFSKKGLDGLTSGRLEQIHHVGMIAEKQVAYDLYMQNLPAFLHATEIQAKVATSAKWYPVKLPLDKAVPIPFPPLTVSPMRPFRNEEEKISYKNNLGAPAEEVRSPRGVTFVIRSPTPAIIAALPFPSIDPNTPSASDATSLLGMKSFIKTLRIISLFLATHSYPYKQTPDSTINQFGLDAAIGWEDGYALYCRNDTMRGDPDEVTDEERAMTGADVKGLDYPISSGTTTALRNSVAVAKPAPLRPEINYGTPQTTPNFPGYVLPYFRGIIEPSKPTIISVMRRYFIGSIADSEETAADSWYDWCRGVDKWYQTESGKILTHILFNIQTALEAQARLFLYIRENDYLGCAILGYGSGVMVDGKFRIPETSASVRTLALSLDDHSMAVEKIKEIVNGVRRDNGLMEVDDEELTTSRKVYRFISESPRVSETEMDQLRDQVSKLSFNDRLWSAVVQNITRAIDLLTVDDDLAEDLPMYLDPGMIYDTSRAYQVLSAFGPAAPSFLEAVGEDFPIPKGALDEDPLSVIDPTNGKKKMDCILVSLKKINVAVADWKNVVKKRRIRQNTEKRDAGFRTIEYRGEARDSIWASLKKIPFEVAGEKRKRAADEEGEGTAGPSKKKGRDEGVVEKTMTAADFF